MPVLICYDGSVSAQRALSVAASSLDGRPWCCSTSGTRLSA